MSKKIILIIVGVVGLVCVGCIAFAALVGGGVFFLTKGIADTSDTYLEAIKQGDYQKAYDLSAPNVQDELGSPEGLQKFVSENGFFPESWNFNNRSVNNNNGTLTGTVTLKGGVVVNTEMNFQKINGDWRVTGINFHQQ